MTGRVDHHLADRLAARLAGTWAGYDPARTPCDPGGLPGCAGPHGRGGPDPDRAGQDEDADARAARDRRQERSRAAARELILRNAVALLSGPTGLASRLRTGRLTGPAASISLPLDCGTATDTIPAHLRRAVILRDQHCAAPGCDVPAARCQIHHIIPVSQGGTTSLDNMHLGCLFHHLIAIHTWGWRIVLNADGTKTAISPDGKRILNSHDPPHAA